MFTGQIVDDINKYSSNMYGDLSNPQVTYFQKIMGKRPTHFRTWIRNVPLTSVKDQPLVNVDDYKTINMISNLSVILTSPKKIGLHDIIEMITKITIKIGDINLIELEGWTILELLKIYPQLYEKTAIHYEKYQQLIIPLQYFIMGKDPLSLCAFDQSTYITCENTLHETEIACSFECTNLSESEYRKQALTAYGTLVSSYKVENISVSNDEIEVPLDMPILIRDLVLISKNATIKASIDGIDFLRGDDPMLTYWQSTIPTMTSYYYRSGSLRDHQSPVIDDRNITGFIAGNDKRKINIKCDSSKSQNLKLIIRYDNRIINARKILSFTVRTHYIKPNYDNYCPLIKNKDGSFTEGYWFSDCEYNETAHKYPFPKQTDIPVDPQFLNQLQLITESCFDKEEQNPTRTAVDYFGSSSCRLCGERNGGTEFIVKNGDVIFKYPSGLMHYYKEHNVHPSQQFHDFIMSQNI